jgi:hypothetical protein
VAKSGLLRPIGKHKAFVGERLPCAQAKVSTLPS